MLMTRTVGVQGTLAQIALQLIPADPISPPGVLLYSLQKFFKSIVVVSMLCIIVIALQPTRQRPNRILKLMEYIALGVTVVAITIGALLSACV